MTADKLKEQLENIPFGSEEYIKTLANLIYIKKDILAKAYTRDVCMLGVSMAYGEDTGRYEDILDNAYGLIAESNDPGICLLAAVCLVMEGKKKIHETFSNK